LHVVAGGGVENAGVADVRAVEVAEEVDKGGEREDGEVLFSEDDALLFFCVVDWGELKFNLLVSPSILLLTLKGGLTSFCPDSTSFPSPVFSGSTLVTESAVIVGWCLGL
jgi:hypothetical protein